MKKRESNPSYDIFKTILTLEEYKNKDEVMEKARKLAEHALSKDDIPDNVKEAYLGAVARLDGLSFKEMKEIIDILSGKAMFV